MGLTSADLLTILINGFLVIVVASCTVVFSALCGIAVAYYARRVTTYGLALGLLFLPYALGQSVWAYGLSNIFRVLGFEPWLLGHQTIVRAIALSTLCFARTLPLGIFFCATSLHRYTAETLPYCQIHRLPLSFYLLIGLDRLPSSLLYLLGLFGGALMSSEVSLATFLYRANPGTGPETVNILLSRLFMDLYAEAGPTTLAHIAGIGLFISVGLLLFALAGSFLGYAVLANIRRLLARAHLENHTLCAAIEIPLLFVTCLAFLSSLPVLAGIVLPLTQPHPTFHGIGDPLSAYWPILSIGLLVGTVTTIGGIALAIKLRYSRNDRLTSITDSPVMMSLLMVPAFLPVLTVVAFIGGSFLGVLSGPLGFAALIICHLALHYPVFQFICFTVVSEISELRVGWQRSAHMRFSFSFFVDGILHQRPVVICLIALGVIQVLTDGSVSRWFSQIVTSPEETLYAAVFGRLSSVNNAIVITCLIGAIACLVCSAIALTYVRSMKGNDRYV